MGLWTFSWIWCGLVDLGVGFSESDHGFRVLDLVDLRFQVLVLGFLSLWWVRELRVRVWSPWFGL